MRNVERFKPVFFRKVSIRFKNFDGKITLNRFNS